jgi:tRNA-dihydrouridine synthase B
MPEPTPPAFWVGSIPIMGRLILAPMDGVTDLPFRVMTRRLGSAMSYTEFINAIDVLNGHPRIPRQVKYLEEERPIVFQIYDNNADRMVEACQVLELLEPDIIDINMGCPAKTVSHRGAGAGLLREPEKVAEIVRKLVAYLKIPVTAKIRLGWDDKSRNYLEIARIIEDSGAAMLAVHGRTRMQNYTGVADWDAIAEIKQNMKIPVLGNGDVTSTEDIQHLLAHTQCDGVMIGRGAIENPWIFSGLDREFVRPELVYQSMLDQLDSMLKFSGPSGIISFRKFAKRYLKPYQVEQELLRSLLTCNEVDRFRQILDRIFSSASMPV